jgi:preprotein translocase subunit SecG
MRRSRRGGGSGAEFGSSGEDSFVAVVVTKLTGALLFILLLTMVIMALLPKAADLEAHDKNTTDPGAAAGQGPLRIATPSRLPEAIAGRPYLVALAATGGRGPLAWSIEGPHPEWLHLDEPTGQVAGTPPQQTKEPVVLELQVTDGMDTDQQETHLVVLPYQPTETGAAAWKHRLATVPWRAWLEQGVGFLVLWLVHLLGMNLLANFERTACDQAEMHDTDDTTQDSVSKRFASYRLLIRLATLVAMIVLALWLGFASAWRA